MRSELPANRIVESVFDAAGNVVQETNARGFVTTHTYDTLERRVRTEAPEVGTRQHERTWSYDLVGNVLAETDPRGNTTTFAYDALNRRVRQQEI